MLMIKKQTTNKQTYRIQTYIVYSLKKKQMKVEVKLLNANPPHLFFFYSNEVKNKEKKSIRNFQYFGIGSI